MWKQSCYQVLGSSLKNIKSALVGKFICFELCMCVHVYTVYGCVHMQKTEIDITYLFCHSPFCFQRQGLSSNLRLAAWASQGFSLSLPPSAGITGFFHGGWDGTQFSYLYSTSLSPLSHLPSPSFEISKRRFIRFSKTAESGQCGSNGSPEAIRSWLDQHVASCRPWCFHLLWIRKYARQLLLYFSNSAAYQEPQRHATVRVKNGGVCFLSLSFLGSKIVLGNSLKDSEDTPCL